MNLKRWFKSRSAWSPLLVGACLFAFIICQGIVYCGWGWGCPRYCDIPQHRTLILCHHGQQLWFNLPTGYDFDFTEYPEIPRPSFNDLVRARTFQMPGLWYLYHVVILMDIGAVFKVIAFVENNGFSITCWIYDNDGIPVLTTENHLDWLIDEYYGMRALL